MPGTTQEKINVRPKDTENLRQDTDDAGADNTIDVTIKQKEILSNVQKESPTLRKSLPLP